MYEIPDLMENMALFLQETHLYSKPMATQLSKFNFNIAYSVHGILTDIEKSIEINRTKNYCNDKIELIASNVHA